MDCSVEQYFWFKVTYMYSSALRNFLYFYPITGHPLFFPTEMGLGNDWLCMAVEGKYVEMQDLQMV